MAKFYYEFFNPVKILSGHKALDNLPSELEIYNARRPMILTDTGVSRAGLVDLVLNAFAESGITVGVLYDQIPPDSDVVLVNQLATLFKQHECDSIVAVGGGSVIDTAKGINIVVTEESDDLLKFMGAEVLRKTMKPLIVVPTTSGTGSEVTCIAVISDHTRNIKLVFSSQYLLPRAAVLDARMTMTLPPKMTAATGMDALTHAIEAYICIQKNPMSDAYAWQAVRLISQNLLRVVTDGKDAEARLAMANGSTMAGIAFSNSMVGMAHSFGHACGSVCQLPHGVAVNIFLPHALEYNLGAAGEAIGELLLPLAGDEAYARTPKAQRPDCAIAEVRRLQAAMLSMTGLPVTLEAAGVAYDALPAIAAAALDDGSAIMNPVDFSLEEAVQFLERAYR